MLVTEDLSEEKFRQVQQAVRMAIHRVWLLACQYIYTFGFPSMLLVLQVYNLLWNCKQGETAYKFPEEVEGVV